jgi:peptidoglycan/LPS O-acetylase OafA/YrhL
MIAVSEGISLSERDFRDVATKASSTVASPPLVADQVEKERIGFLDALKATGIVMVVAVHVLSRIELSESDRDLMMYLVGTIAVPLFFVADGCLLSWKFTGAPQFDRGSFVRKSASRLLVPWAGFTILYATIRMMLEWLKLTRETVLLGNDFSEMVQAIYLSRISPHMYFLLSLFIVRLGMVGFYRTLQWSMWTWFAVSIMYMGIYHLSLPKDWFLPGADPILLACWGAQFYFLGIALQKGLNSIRLHAEPLLVFCIVGAIGSRLLSPANALYVSQAFYLVSACITLLLITERTNWSFSMGRDTMGIYLLHAPVIVWGVATIVTALLPAVSLVAFGVTTCASVLVSWFVTRLMERSSGGRLLLGQLEFAQRKS